MQLDYFETLDTHPSIRGEALAYINKLLGDNGTARVKHNPHDFGEYLTIEVSRYDDEPDEYDETEEGIAEYEKYDVITNKLNKACDQWRKKYADKVEALYNN